MPESTSSPRLSLSPLIAGMLAAPILAGLIGWGVAVAAGWSTQPPAWSTPTTIAAAAGSWIFASLIGLLLTSLISGHHARRIPFAILVASAVRVGVALFDGLFIALVFKPDSKTFWCTFLLAGLLCLVFETAWCMLAIRRTTRMVGGVARGVGPVVGVS